MAGKKFPDQPVVLFMLTRRIKIQTRLALFSQPEDLHAIFVYTHGTQDYARAKAAA